MLPSHISHAGCPQIQHKQFSSISLLQRGAAPQDWTKHQGDRCLGIETEASQRGLWATLISFQGALLGTQLDLHKRLHVCMSPGCHTNRQFEAAPAEDDLVSGISAPPIIHPVFTVLMPH